MVAQNYLAISTCYLKVLNQSKTGSKTIEQECVPESQDFSSHGGKTHDLH